MINIYKELKKRNIFQTSNRLCMFWTFCVAFMLFVLMIVMYNNDTNSEYKIISVGILFVIFGGAFIIIFILALIEVRKYNYLLEYGKMVKGRIISSGIPSTAGVKVKASYFDNETEKEYVYVSGTPKLMEPNRMRYYVRTYPEIDILIDENNKKNGVILIDKYYIEMQNEHGDEPYQLNNMFKY